MLSGVALVCLTLTVPPTAAVCVTGIPYEQLEPEHGLIFEGKVTHIPGEAVFETIVMAPGTVEFRGLRVWFRVDRVWKGDPGSDLELIYTHHAQQIHGRFNEGDAFIVWAYQRDGRWSTNDCAPTIERELASPEMLVFLDKLKK